MIIGKKRWCRLCGKELIEESETIEPEYPFYYDEYTGERRKPIVYVEYSCPDYNWDIKEGRWHTVGEP